MIFLFKSQEYKKRKYYNSPTRESTQRRGRNGKKAKKNTREVKSKGEAHTHTQQKTHNFANPMSDTGHRREGFHL